MDEAIVRIPALAETGIRKFYNGPESFTPDNQFLLGQAPGAATATSSAPASTRSGSPRRAVRAARSPSGSSRASRPATWSAVDVRRFAPFHGDEAWLRSRVAEILGLHYEVPWPLREPETGRPQRRLAAARPARRAGCRVRQPDGLGAAARVRTAAGAPTHGVHLGEAGLAALVRRRAARDAGAGRGLRPDVVLAVRRRRPRRARLRCSGSAPPTSTSRSAAASTRRSSTRRGTYEADLTVTRTGRRLLPAGLELGHDDPRPGLDRPAPCAAEPTSTSATAPTTSSVIGVMGPRSRELLGRVSTARPRSADWSDESFPFATSRR